MTRVTAGHGLGGNIYSNVGLDTGLFLQTESKAWGKLRIPLALQQSQVCHVQVPLHHAKRLQMGGLYSGDGFSPVDQSAGTLALSGL